jgi:hypothetical protein
LIFKLNVIFAKNDIAMNINDLLNQDNESTVLTQLKRKKVDVPEWDTLKSIYEGDKHSVNDKSLRQDKVNNGKIEKVSRIYLDIPKLITSRMVEFMFSIPVKRVYSGLEDNKHKDEIYKALEKIYRKNRINTANNERSRQFFASCEICTLWYTVDKKNKDYGFKSDKKIKMKTYSQMEGYEFYPLFDEYDDLICMSIQYSQEDENGKSATYFDSYTDARHVVWKDGVRIIDEENPLGKIPYIYASRKEPIYWIISHLVEEIELTLSRNSDVIAYNSAPILQVVGKILKGEENKETVKRIFEVTDGGSVSYVTWQQAIESIKFQIDTLLRLIWMLVQLPDLSFENIKGLGVISGEAIKNLLTDAHLKVGDEQGVFLEFFDREFNLIKAYLRMMHPEWAEALEDVEVEHIITPFVQNDEMNEIEKSVKATGGKPVLSQKSAMKRLGVENAEEEYNEILREEEEQNQRQVIDIFHGGA